MRTATAAAATFHKARYQNALIASTTAASLRTRRLEAAATSTTFLAAPIVATPTGAPTTATATATTIVNKQTQEQQQTTNKTWPPGSSFASGRRRVAAAASTDTFACAPVEGSSGSSNNTNQHNQYQSSSEKPNQRSSGQINLFPDPIPNTTNHKSVASSARAYKRVHLPAPGIHSNETRQDIRVSRGQSVESLAARATDTETTPLVPRRLHLAQLDQQQTAHEYQELTADDDDDGDYNHYEEPVQWDKEPQVKSNQLDIGAALATSIKNHENHSQLARRQLKFQQQIKASNDKRKPQNLTMTTLRPISPQYQRTLDSAISLSKELASKNMADSGESSPKTPNSPDKKRFNFKLKHFIKSYSEALANIRDIESSISDEAKLAYKSLVERGQFNSHHQPFGCDGGGRSLNNYRDNSPNGLRDLYANDDFHSPTTPPATTSKFKYSTFSVKKTFF